MLFWKKQNRPWRGWASKRVSLSGWEERDLVVRWGEPLLCAVAVETNLDLSVTSSSPWEARECVCVGTCGKMTESRHLKVKLEPRSMHGRFPETHRTAPCVACTTQGPNGQTRKHTQVQASTKMHRKDCVLALTGSLQLVNRKLVLKKIVVERGRGFGSTLNFALFSLINTRWSTLGYDERL